MNECLAEGGNPCLDGDCVNLEPDYECLCYAGFRFRGGACVGRFPLSPTEGDSEAKSNGLI